MSAPDFPQFSDLSIWERRRFEEELTDLCVNASVALGTFLACLHFSDAGGPLGWVLLVTFVSTLVGFTGLRVVWNCGWILWEAHRG